MKNLVLYLDIHESTQEHLILRALIRHCVSGDIHLMVTLWQPECGDNHRGWLGLAHGMSQ
jgi:hypothetical protein